MEDAYDRLVHAKVESHERKEYLISLAQFVAGSAALVGGCVLAFMQPNNPDFLFAVVGIGLALYLYAGGVFVPRLMIRSARYPSFHRRPFTASKGAIARGNALYDNVIGLSGTTPTLTALRHKAQIVFLLRMLGIVAIAALLVVTFAINSADSNRTAIYQNYVTDEVWLTDHNGQWYGIGP